MYKYRELLNPVHVLLHPVQVLLHPVPTYVCSYETYVILSRDTSPPVNFPVEGGIKEDPPLTGPMNAHTNVFTGIRQVQ